MQEIDTICTVACQTVNGIGKTTAENMREKERFKEEAIAIGHMVGTCRTDHVIEKGTETGREKETGEMIEEEIEIEIGETIPEEEIMMDTGTEEATED